MVSVMPETCILQNNRIIKYSQRTFNTLCLGFITFCNIRKKTTEKHFINSFGP